MIVELVTVTAIHRRGGPTAPPNLSEGWFVATTGRMQEVTVVVTTTVILIAAASPGAREAGPALFIVLVVAIAVFTSMGHGVRYEVEFSALTRRQLNWSNGIQMIMGAMMVHAAVSYRMIVSGAVDDPMLRWGWTAALELLLLGVLNCGLAIEANQRRPDQRLELLVALVLLPIPVAVTALTVHSSAWVVAQLVVLCSFLVPYVRRRGFIAHGRMHR